MIMARPSTSIEVQTMLSHMHSRMPRKTIAASSSRKPSDSTRGGTASRPTSRCRLSATTRDWVAIEVRPEHITASPTT
jgi:hypothetical protein